MADDTCLSNISQNDYVVKDAPVQDIMIGSAPQSEVLLDDSETSISSSKKFVCTQRVSYDGCLQAFSRIPSTYTCNDVENKEFNFPASFLAWPVCFRSCIQFSIVPLFQRTKIALEKLLKFQRFDMSKFVEVHPREVVNGKVYGYYHKGQFARVQVNHNGYTIAYDFGQLIVEVDKDDLFVLPEEIVSIPSLRYRAAMDGLECTLDKKGSGFIKNEFGDSLLLVDEAHLIQSSGNKIILAHFYSQDKLIDYNNVVVEAGYAVLKRNHKLQSNAPPVQQVDSLSSWHPGNESSFKVYLTCVVSPANIWGQVFDDDTLKLQYLMEEMNELYLSKNSDSSFAPNVGEICAAKYFDGLYYRAKVLSIPHTGKLSVQFLDYGNIETVSGVDVRLIESKFLSLPKQAVRFTLANVKPVGLSWSQDACELVRELMLEKIIEIDILSEDGLGYVINAHSDVSSSLINDILIEKGFAVTKNKSSMKGVSNGKQFIKIGRGSAFNHTSQLKMESLKINSVTASKTCAGTNSYCISKPTKGTLSMKKQSLATLIINDSASEVKSSQTYKANKWTPSKNKPAPHNNNAVKSMKTVKGSLSKPLAPVVVSNVLKHMSLPDGLMNAVVTHINNIFSFYVVLTDRSTYQELTRMTNDMQSRKLINLHDFYEGITCVAKSPCDGLYHRGKVVELSAQGVVKIQFVDLGYIEAVKTSDLCALDKIYCRIPCQAIHCSLSGLSDALESNCSQVTECFRRLTQDHNLQIKKVSISDGIYSVKVFSSNDDITKKIENLLLVPTSMESVKSTSPIAKFSSLQTLDFPTASSNEYVNVRLSHIVSPHSLFIHLAVEPYFSQLGTLISWSYENLRCFDCSLEVDDMCIALFAEDGNWYRARVVNTTETSEYIVQFVDFGNTETVNASSVRVCPEGLLSFPIMALECSLNGIVPVNGKTWDSACTQFLSGNFMDKILVAKFDGTMNIDLYDTSGANDVNLADILMKQGYAVSSSETYEHEIIIPAFSLASCDSYFEVIVSEVESTSLIWLQDASTDSQNAISQLQSSLQLYCSLANSETSTPTEGSYCCVVYPDGGYCFRAQVLKLTDESVHVLLVDFGTKDCVNCCHIVPITHSLAELPMFSFCVSLLCDVDEDSTAKLIEFAKGKQFGVQIIDSSSFPPKAELLDSSGKNILHQIRPNSPSLSPTNVLKSSVLPLADEFEVLVVHVESLQEIYFQLLSSNGPLLLEMSKYIEEFATSAPPLASRPVPGQICLANSKIHGFYRAEVVSCDDELTCIVKAVDYGNIEMLNLEDLRDINPNILVYPKQSFKCSMIGINKTADLKATQFVKDRILVNEPVVCHVYSRFHQLLVDFHISHTTVRNLLAQEMLLPPFNVSNYALPFTSVPSDTPILVASTDINSPGHFWVQKADKISISETGKNFVELQGHCTMASLPEAPVCLGQLVCTKFEEDSLWYRGRVIDINEDELLLVHFIDYGNCQKTQLSNMRSITSQLFSFPAQALLCSLDESFDENACSIFKKLVDGRYLLCTFKGQKDGFKWVVDLVDRETEHNIREVLVKQL